MQLAPTLSIATALLVGCGASAPSPEAPPAPLTLRVATWNVHDLFDEIDREAPPGQEDTVLTHGEVEAKLDRIARVLGRADADVAVLQEVENLPLLERLASRLPGYGAHLVEGRDPRGIDIGVLARVPVHSYRSHRDERSPGGGFVWSRDLVELHLEAGSRPVILLCNHLVSRRTPGQDERRRAQAARARAVLEELRAARADALVLVVGDLNDLPGSAALEPLLGDGRLVDVGAALPSSLAWTWSGGGARERIDDVLLPREDARAVLRVEVLEGEDVQAASDHRPVVVDLWP